MLAFKALCSAVLDDKLFYLIVDKLHTTVLAGFHKCFYDILCVVAHREHPVATLSFKLHTKTLKKAHNVLWSKSAQCRIHELAVAWDIFHNSVSGTVVCDVTPALSCYHEFSALTAAMLDNSNALSTPAKLNCAEHSCRTCACYNCVKSSHCVSSSLFA